MTILVAVVVAIALFNGAIAFAWMRHARRWREIYESEHRISAKWLAATAELMRCHDPDQYCRLVSQLSRRGLPIPERISAKDPIA